MTSPRSMISALAAKGLLACLGILAPAHAESAPAAKAVLEVYGEIAETMYRDAYKKAGELKTAVDALLAKPDAATLSAARAAWKEARVPYQQTEGFRFGNKIVDDFEGEVNSWPLDEGLIDYVDKASYGETKEDNPLYTANVIANASIQLGAKTLDAKKIDKALVKQLNGALEVEANVGTGYHAIEFLLWGQDLNGTGPGAGNRPATDYDLKACTGGHCDRRRDYLVAVTDLLIDDLKTMVDAWNEGGEGRKELAAKGDNGGLTSILTGLGSLSYGELAGERMKLGVLLHDTEEEHDCFSDNTHNSHFNDQAGMMAIWNGSYTSVGGKTVEGASIAALARAKDAAAAKRVDDAMAATLGKLKAIKDKADSGAMAYDQMLAAGNEEGNKLILDAVDALVAQTRAMEGVVTALGLKIEVEGSDSLDKPEAVKTQ